ncbi:MAG: ankyrin repeat domain-containing protein [Planctomycetota bacterium]|nr:ankyrin repeat domain-containing protein [Planctomycetota bacterium]
MNHLDPEQTIESLEAAARLAGGDEAVSKQRLAEHHGFLTWRQMVVHQILFAPGEADHAENQNPAFERLACLQYGVDDPENWERAARDLKGDPGLSQRNIWCAAAAGDVESVAQFLDREPDLLNRRGGFSGWEPLLYATYSRLELPGFDTAGVARLLLERGADANAHFMWDGIYRFTALTGVFGHGEKGPVRSPEHPGGLELARALLESGADPADGQALYNRMFADGESACLRLLLDGGLNGTHKNNWRSLGPDGELGGDADLVLTYQLRWAVENHHPERAQLLLKAGASPQATPGGVELHGTAVAMGYPEVAKALLQAGAPEAPLTAVDRLAGACMAGDLTGAQGLIASHPGLWSKLERERPDLVHKAAAGNRVEALRTLAGLGANLDRMLRNAPLHEAAWHGRLAAAKVLVELGANLALRDATHGGMPADWATHAGHPELADWLNSAP